MNNSERRQMERYALDLPAHFATEDEAGVQKSIEVHTSNICAGGALFITNKPLSVGTQADIDMVLTLGKDTPAPLKSSVKLTGEVVRSDRDGMAIIFHENYKISPYFPS
jgi:hypothetical protein